MQFQGSATFVPVPFRIESSQLLPLIFFQDLLDSFSLHFVPFPAAIRHTSLPFFPFLFENVPNNFPNIKFPRSLSAPSRKCYACDTRRRLHGFAVFMSQQSTLQFRWHGTPDWNLIPEQNFPSDWKLEWRIRERNFLSLPWEQFQRNI